MNTKYKYIIVGLAIFLVFMLGVSVKVGNKQFGSVAVSSECVATTSNSFWANTPMALGSSTLCNVLVGTPDVGGAVFELRDATSSTDVASTSLLVIGGRIATGTPIMVDVAVKRGIMVNTPVGFTGRYTVTVRTN